MLILAHPLVMAGHKGGPDDVVVTWRVCAKADDDGDDAGGDEQARGEVHVVDGGDQPGPVVSFHAEGSLCGIFDCWYAVCIIINCIFELCKLYNNCHLVRKVHCHSSQTNTESVHQSKESALKMFFWKIAENSGFITFSLIRVERMAMR